MKVFFLTIALIYLLYGDYIAYNNGGNHIVYDTTTDLTWLNEPYTSAEDNAYNNNSESGKVLLWGNAINYCEKLKNYAGKSDWRLPNINELYTITNKQSCFFAADSIFEQPIGDSTKSFYWSSTTYDANISQAWQLFFFNGSDNFQDKNKSAFVRCVRGGEIHMNNNISILMYLLY